MGLLRGLFLLLLCSGLRVGGHPRCRKSEFACHDGRCVSASLLCNGANDCGDGSDEESCQNCTSGLISCGPLDGCLPAHKLCDGRADCRDGRDEAQARCARTEPPTRTSPTCTASEFQCGDGHCIRQAWRCDYSSDCSDGSDEENCDQNECRVNNGGCSHACTDLTMGFRCECPENTRLVGGHRCEEVDPCLEVDVCDQLCVHRKGGVTCGCSEGYSATTTTGLCKAKGGDARLVFVSSEGVEWTTVTGAETERRELVPPFSGAGSVAASASNATLYWARRGSIYRLSVDQTPPSSTLVLKVKGLVSGLALDWIHRLLYWTDVEGGSVNVAQLDSRTQRQLVAGLDRPSAVAVDSLRGLLFWGQCGRLPKIERAGLDGQDTVTLVTSLIQCPVALCLDLPRQLLYWVDQGKRSISRVNLDGRDRKTVVESNGHLDQPFGLAVFEGSVYWIDGVSRTVCRANKHNGSRLHVLLENITAPGDLAIVHPALQPNGPSVCGSAGTVCRHQCVVDLQSERPEFSCDPPETGQNETPAISHTGSTSSLSDPTFAGILSLITFLGVLLVGMAVWWWREQCRPATSLTVQSFSLKESRDPLIAQAPSACPKSCFKKETLLKLDLDGE